MFVFSELFKRLRERSGVTKTKVAKVLGISLTYVLELESGRKVAPDYDRCMIISKVLNLSQKDSDLLVESAMRERFKAADKGFFEYVTRKALIEYNSKEKNSNPRVEEFLLKFRRLSNDGQQKVLTILEAFIDGVV
jgi:transcriptional regulator with XRE-family HTH domain